MLSKKKKSPSLLMTEATPAVPVFTGRLVKWQFYWVSLSGSFYFGVATATATFCFLEQTKSQKPKTPKTKTKKPPSCPGVYWDFTGFFGGGGKGPKKKKRKKNRVEAGTRTNMWRMAMAIRRKEIRNRSVSAAVSLRADRFSWWHSVFFVFFFKEKRPRK